MRMRDRVVLGGCLRAVVAAEPAAGSPEFRRFLAGARAGLEWVVGHTPTAPASAEAKRPTTAQMQSEERYCDRIIYSPDVHPVIDPDYANGVEHALSWARGAEEEPPVPAAGAIKECSCTWQAA